MASSFEKVMNACLESKRVARANAAKSKNTIKKSIKESKKVSKKRALKESDELTDDLDETYDDNDPDVVDDVADDIMVVVDPELSSDEDVSDAAAEAQDIIDSTPDGEVPSTDEYVGDYTYTCPICGNTFFSEVEMSDGDECPVCAEMPDGFVLVGSVESADDTPAEDEGEDLDIEDPVEDEEELVPDDDEAMEAFKRSKRARATKKESKKTIYSKYSLDETTFNPFLSKFIKENYKNAKSFGIVGASKKGSKLALECKLSFKSGKSKKVTLTVENFKPARKMTLAAREDGTFKSESKKAKVAPFVFEGIMTPSNVIKCTGMKYNFITKLKEGKRAQVSGKLIKESKNKSNFQRGRRRRRK